MFLRGLTGDTFTYISIRYLWKLKLTNLAASCPPGKEGERGREGRGGREGNRLAKAQG